MRSFKIRSLFKTHFIKIIIFHTMTKPIFLYATGLLLLAAGCKKPGIVTGPADTRSAYVAVINANASGKTVNIFADNSQLTIPVTTPLAIAPNNAVLGQYVGVIPGTHLLEVRENAGTPLTFYTGNITVGGKQAYSFFIYDTLKLGRFKGILLNTDRNLYATSLNAKVRFLNLSPKSPFLDFWMVRREGSGASAVAKDSVKISTATPYLGNVATPDATALSAVTSIVASRNAGAAGAGTPASDYILKLKLANTNTTVFTSGATNIIPGRNYTFYARGIYPSVAISTVLDN